MASCSPGSSTLLQYCKTSFFLKADEYSIAPVPTAFFFAPHSSVAGHLGGFYISAVVNRAAVNTGVLVSL